VKTFAFRLAVLALLVSASTSHAARPAGSNGPRPAHAEVDDLLRRMDLNALNMATTNFGSTAFDLNGTLPGLVYPRGTDKTTVFASGLWLGAVVHGELRTAIADYSQEFRPGAILPGGSFDDPNRPEYATWKVVRYTGNPLDSTHIDRSATELLADPLLDPVAHHSWSEYLTNAAPHGAPVRLYRLPLTSTPAPGDSIDVLGPAVTGDAMLWSVYNDADPSHHTANAGGTTPLGVEVQQTIFAFDRPGALSTALFIRYHLVNRSSSLLGSMYVSQWADPDVGGFIDDYVGSDPARGMGYGYNATANDFVYGSSPPAVGYVLLQGPTNGGLPLPLTAFSRYINGTDPSMPDAAYNYMRGLLPDGFPMIDPTTFAPTSFACSGDPITDVGWIDSNPSDRRMLLSSGPFDMAPGTSQDVVFAVIVGQGSSSLGSVAALQCAADQVRAAWTNGFDSTAPPPPCPAVVLNCPGPVKYWQGEYLHGASPDHSHAQLDAIAAQVDVESDLLAWPPDSAAVRLRQLLLDNSDVRAAAMRRYAALLANVSVRRLHLPPGSGGDVFLNPVTPISFPNLAAQSIEDLLVTPNLSDSVLHADYLNLVLDHRRPISGVNAGLEAFDGGAGYGSSFLGSSIDPIAQPDSFPTVELRFDHTATQKAYRYLRLELSNGSPPSVGRVYRYSGFFDVGFTAWDVTHDVQLDVAFVERAVCDVNGTLLGPGSQPASQDSTWGPTSAPDGGREYLLILHRAYSPVPKPEMTVDGFVINGSTPALYALWAIRRSDADEFDDGDQFKFTRESPTGPGLDAMLLGLQSQPLSDPTVVAAYNALASSLDAINGGIGIGPVCGPEPIVDVPPDPLFHGGRLEMAPIQPNPVLAGLAITFVLPASGPATLEILDVAGRRVMLRDVGSLGAGQHTLRLDFGATHRAGIYLVRLRQGGLETSRKAVVVR
jgi:hypothetical protein